MHTLGQLVLGAIVVCVPLFLLLGQFARAREAGALRTGGAAGRGSGTALRAPGTRSALRGAGRSAGGSAVAVLAHPGNRAIRAQARADGHRLWAEALATNWLEVQRHGRQNGTAATAGTSGTPGGTTATATATKPTIRQRLRLAPYTAPAQGTGGSNGNGANGNGQQPANGTSQPAAQGNGGPPARQVPPPVQAPPASTNGGTVAGTSNAAAEKMIEGIQEIYARAASGGINAKQEALKAAHEGAVRFASMMQMLARTMSEPGSNYGPEITEPTSKAGMQFQAGAMLLSEADNNLETLANMTLREAAASPRQVPHHEHELSESGRH